MKPSDEDRFAEFVRAHTASLFRTAYLMTGDYQRAEDVLQAALVRVYQHWPRVDAHGPARRLRAPGGGEPGDVVVAETFVPRVAC